MPIEQDIQKIEIRSEDVQEILEATPKWLVRSGITAIFIFILLVLIGSWFFKYPDIITSNIVLVTQNPPAALKSYSTGKITHLFIKEKDTVQPNEIIATIENPANNQHVFLLNKQLDTLTNPLFFSDSNTFSLGEIQPYFSNFIRLINDYKSFLELNYYPQKIKTIKNHIVGYTKNKHTLQKKCKLEKQQLDLSELQYNRNKNLYEKGFYAKAELEKSEQQYLQQKINYESGIQSLTNVEIEINNLKNNILDLELQYQKENKQHQLAIKEANQNLNSAIATWKQNYLIQSPIKGIVTYTQIWSKNQFVNAGKIVAIVTPIAETNIIGIVQIEAQGVGKVKPQQPVQIKLHNFPYMEFGLIKGSIKNISLVPTITEQGAIYTAQVDMPDNLISNYGKKIAFSQEMTGTAEIITEDIRLLERFLNPIKAIWKKNINDGEF